MSHAAVLLIKQHYDDLSTVRALVIGAGEMAELAVRALHLHGVISINVRIRFVRSARSSIEKPISPMVGRPPAKEQGRTWRDERR